MSNSMSVTVAKPFWIAMNKGSYVLLPSMDDQIHYEIVRREHHKFARIREGTNRLEIQVPEKTDPFEMRVWIPKRVEVKVQLENGMLNFNGLQGTVFAQVANGAVEFAPHPNAQEAYHADLTVVSGTLLYKLSGIPTQLTAEVKTGVVNIPRDCRVLLSQRIGYTGEKHQLQCGPEDKQTEGAKLAVQQGTITVR